jgi:hypothetical protein
MKTILKTMSVYLLLFVLLGLCLVPFFCSFKLPSPNTFKPPFLKGLKRSVTKCLNPQYMYNAWYQLEFVRPFCDTLLLEETEKRENFKFYEFYEDPTKGHKREFSNEGLKVIVDTFNQVPILKKPIWASYLFHRNFDENRLLRQDDTLVEEVKGFAIYIANCSVEKSAVLETQDGSAIMVMEALTPDKTWKSIEYWSGSWCGNSYSSITISPSEFAFTRGIRCSGDVRTKCRLKLSNGNDQLYSNEFYMGISNTQFEKPPGQAKER